MAKWTIKMTEKQKLTAKEQAQKLVVDFSRQTFSESHDSFTWLRDRFGTAIREAEKEAYLKGIYDGSEKGNNDNKYFQDILKEFRLKGFRAGQIAMREEAGQMVEMLLFQSLQQNEEAEKWLSNRIRALPISESETLKNEVNNSEVNE